MNSAVTDKVWMRHALQLAERAREAGEVPVGALIVRDGTLIAEGWNCPISTHDPTAHAEMLCIREAAKKLGEPRLPECDLYVTLEPCPMCATAISFARIRKLIYGAYDPKGGGVEHGPKIFAHSTCHHRPEIIGGIDEAECGEILKTFFEKRR